MYVVPFALVRWADGQRWLRRRTAWLLLVASALLPVVLWVCQPDALVGAAGDGRGLAVRLLLYLGHDVNQRDQSGQTPLQRAVTYADPAVVRLLLAHRADPHAVDNGGATALENAVVGGHVALLELLYASGVQINGSNALSLAVGRQPADVVDWLLAHGATLAQQVRCAVRVHGRYLAANHFLYHDSAQGHRLGSGRGPYPTRV